MWGVTISLYKNGRLRMRCGAMSDRSHTARVVEVKKFTSPMRYYGNFTSRKMADITSEVIVTTSQRRARRRTRNPEEWKKTTT